MGGTLGISESERGQRLMLVEQGLVAAMMASVTGLFLTGLVVELGGQIQHVAWIQSAMLIGGFFQVATNSILIRVGSRKRFCLLALATVRLLRTGIAALPFLVTLGIDRSLLLKPLGMLMLLSGVFGMSAEVVRQSWIADLVPASLRGRFFGRRLQISGGVTMVTTLAYAWFIDAWRSFGHDALGAFQIIIGFGAGVGFASLWYIWKIPEPPPHGKTSRTRFLTSLALPFRQQQYRWFIVLRSSFSFSAGLCGGFFHFFMLHYLGMSYILIGATDFLSQLIGLVAAPYWGRLADQWGTKRMLTIALVAKAIFPFLWLVMLPQWWYLVFAVVLMRVFNTAQEIGFLNLGLQLAPRENRAAYIAMERGLNNLVRAGAPALAGILAVAIGESVWKAGAIPFTALHLLFLLSGIARLASLVFLRKISEPTRREFDLVDVNESQSSPND